MLKPIDAESFLSCIWPESLLRNETLELRAIHRGSKKIERKFFNSKKEFLSGAKSYGSGWDIYFGICTRYLQGGKKSDCYRVKCVWVDFDKVKKLPDFGKLPPDIVINSGAGFHTYWILESPVYVRDGRWKEIEATNRGLIKKYGGDAMCVDISRILRVPGFMNHKYDPPRKVEASAIQAGTV